MAIEFIHGSHDASLEFPLGCDADVAQHRACELGEEAIDEIKPRAVRGREGEFEAADRLIGEPSLGLLGKVRGMIIEDQLDRCMDRIDGVEKLEKFDEFATAVAILDEGVNLAGQQINPGQQAEGAMALVFMIAREGRVPARLGRQGGGRGGDRLNTGLLVIGDDRNCLARLLFCGGSLLLDQLDLTIDTQDLRHLLLELRVAALQVIADLVRLYLLFIEDVAQRALSQFGKADVPRSSANSSACRHPAMTSILVSESEKRGYRPSQQN